MCSLSKEQFILSRETIKSAFFSELCPFFNLDFYPLSSTPQPSNGTPMLCESLKIVACPNHQNACKIAYMYARKKKMKDG